MDIIHANIRIPQGSPWSLQGVLIHGHMTEICITFQWWSHPQNGHMGAEIRMVGVGHWGDVDVVLSKTVVENDMWMNNLVSLESLHS
jgi:hypothetical protein